MGLARAVVSQFYMTEAENEYVIRANSAIMKCKIPSFVSEFVYVDQWTTDDGTIYRPEDGDYVVQQLYESRVIDEFVLRGNTATLKCLVPSFVGDFVDVIEWRADDGTIYMADDQEEKGIYDRMRETLVGCMNEFVKVNSSVHIRNISNTLIKCIMFMISIFSTFPIYIGTLVVKLS